MNQQNNEWTNVIKSDHSLFKLNLKEVWEYRDLVYMFVKRDFVSGFKQTILGPLWFFINPIFTTIVFLIVFGNIAKLSTDGAPKILFYLAGVTLWNYFSSSLGGTSNVFVGNANIFGKVYFPRLVMPITIVISNLMKFGVQFVLFLLVFFYYWHLGEVTPNWWVLFTPIFIFMMSLYALGLGMIFSSLTTKYRDLSMLLSFGVSLYMYATPVIYPTSLLSAKIQPFAKYNPLTGIFEGFKYAWMGVGEFNPIMLIYSAVIILALLALGTIIFNKVEKGFMDTV
ncbi:ABC transporter permease [Cloacibacterium sp.]|uniref:ABC transporter permease n=1 Tax=Cloacibacterium sp. TaxID=1913682 RepID=UPI0039E49C30